MPELLVKLEVARPECPACYTPTEMEPYTIGTFRCPSCECVDDIG